MFELISANKRYLAEHGWLKSFHLFSFADYYDENNVEFGNLRVFNDDYVEAGKGFGAHPHANMEIITIVLEGEITHQDSMGHKETLKAGWVQAMTAGTGIVHSEYNFGKNQLHSYQIWIKPREAGLKPAYSQIEFEKQMKNGGLVAVASGGGEAGAAKINADANVFVCKLEKGEEVEYEAKKGRKIFVYLKEGEIEINGKKVGKEEQARITDEKDLKIRSKKNAWFTLIDA